MFCKMSAKKNIFPNMHFHTEEQRRATVTKKKNPKWINNDTKIFKLPSNIYLVKSKHCE